MVCATHFGCQGGMFWDDIYHDGPNRWEHEYKFIGQKPKNDEHIIVFWYDDMTMDRGIEQGRN